MKIIYLSVGLINVDYLSMVEIQRRVKIEAWGTVNRTQIVWHEGTFGKIRSLCLSKLKDEGRSTVERVRWQKSLCSNHEIKSAATAQSSAAAGPPNTLYEDRRQNTPRKNAHQECAQDKNGPAEDVWPAGWRK